MPIYHYLEYECPLMMHEGAFASLKLLMDSFLFIKRINLMCILPLAAVWLHPNLDQAHCVWQCTCIWWKTALPNQLAGHGEIAPLHRKTKTAQIINGGAVRKRKTYALECADEERDEIFPYHWTSFYKMRARSHLSVLAPKSRLPWKTHQMHIR